MRLWTILLLATNMVNMMAIAVYSSCTLVWWLKFVISAIETTC